MTTTGIKYHNPGNIRRVKGVVWEGQDDKQGGTFVRFKEPKWGIRAIARVLITYADARLANDGSRIDTVQEFIERWAPPAENDTASYAGHVRLRLGVAKGSSIDIKDPVVMKQMIEAIITHENGSQPYSDAQLVAGMVLAGIEPVRAPLQATRTVKGAQVASLAATATTAAGVAAEVAPALPVLSWLRDNLGFALIVLGAVALIGVGVMVWARLDDRRKGLR